VDLTLRTETFSQDDQRWLVSDHGADTGRTVTLDVSKFTKADHYPDGYLKSGLVICKFTSGKYGPYDPTKNTGDGSNVGAPVGLLLEAVQVKTDATAVAGALVLHCFVDKSKLPVTDTDNKGSVGVDDSTSGSERYAADLPHVIFV
jgi:hypothetical protein